MYEESLTLFMAVETRPSPGRVEITAPPLMPPIIDVTLGRFFSGQISNLEVMMQFLDPKGLFRRPVSEISVPQRNPDLRTVVFRGPVHEVSEGQIRFALTGAEGYTHVQQEGGRTNLWLDVSERVRKGETRLLEEHPLFAPFVQDVDLPGLVAGLTRGERGEIQFHREIGKIDLWGFFMDEQRILREESKMRAEQDWRAGRVSRNGIFHK